MRRISKSIKKTIIRRDVQGEIDCFCECYKRLLGQDKILNNKKGEIREPYKRICSDCFLLHARNLYDFFCTIPRKDDVSAIHFYPGTTKLISDVPIDRINKQLSHITWDRLSPRQRDLFSEKEKIYNAIINAADEYNQRAEKNHKLKISN